MNPTPSKSILFLCVYNACRSRIGEAIARKLAPSTWRIDSAGCTPSEDVDKNAAAVLERHGLAMSAGKPKPLFAHPSGRWDCVVDISCMGGGARLPARKYVRWDIPDPMGGPTEVYEGLFADLHRRVRELIRDIRAEPA